MMQAHTLTLAALLAISTSASAQIYRWTDAAGNVHFSDNPPVAAELETVEAVQDTPAVAKSSGLRPGELRMLVDAERRHAATVAKARRARVTTTNERAGRSSLCDHFNRWEDRVQDRQRAGIRARNAQWWENFRERMREGKRRNCN